MCGVLNLGLLLLSVEILLSSMPVIDAAPRWSFMKLHAQLNLTQHEHLDTPLVELIPELAEVTPEAIQDCHESIHSRNSSHSALFVPGALLRDVLHEFYSFYDDKSITNRQITNVLKILRGIVQHVLKCNPHLQKRDINYRKPRWKAGLNVVADMEFHQLVGVNFAERLPKMGQLAAGNCEGALTSVKDLPATLDMREKSPKVIGHIRNQDFCGSCWAHTTVGVAEAALIQAGHTDTPLLSPQYPTDFDDTNSGCIGGRGMAAFTWASTNGFVSEATYPYKGLVHIKGDKPKVEYTVSGYCFKNQETSFEERKQMVHTHGGLWVALKADFWLILYRSGVYNSETCKTSGEGHAMTMVGYGADYILLRNSWTSWWGDGGMIKFDPDACYANTQMGYFIV